MKRFLVLALLLTALTLPVSAEQPAAEEYRQMFRSGNFYIEYRMTVFEHMHSPTFTLAGQDGKRMQRIVFDRVRSEGWDHYYKTWTSLSGAYFQKNSSRMNMKIAGRESTSDYYRKLFGGTIKKKYPDALYQDGKYYRFVKAYQFHDKTTAYGKDGTVYAKVLSEENLNLPTLNPSDEWDFIREDLALPDEFAIFYWEEPFRDDVLNRLAPRYNGSSKRTIKSSNRKVEDKEYDCDQYISDIKSLAGTIIAQEAYNMLYDEGKLVKIQKYFIRDGKEQLVLEIEVLNITPVVPVEAFTIGQKIKVYVAENGDMNDLLERPILVETLGGK